MADFAVLSDGSVTAFIISTIVIGALFALWQARTVLSISLVPAADNQHFAQPHENLLVNQNSADVFQKVRDISKLIADGANTFLGREYTYIAVFMGGFSVLLLLLLGFLHGWAQALFAVLSFLVGASTSILCGWIGMKQATASNSRTCVEAQYSYDRAFNVAFRAGTVMGFALVAIGALVLYVLLFIVHSYWPNAVTMAGQAKPVGDGTTSYMFEAIAGFGLGGSSVALFGRVGGGIYTKCADVGADLVGKVEKGLPEDDPRNPATVADNVGDNVGDIAGMGADLFGSFAESACACMVIASNSPQLNVSWASMVFPIAVSGAGILVSLLTTFFATHLTSVKQASEIEPTLKRQILVSTILMTPVSFLICYYFLPHTTFVIGLGTVAKNVEYYYIFFCLAAGLWSGMIIGYTTEYYTSNAYTPVRELSESCKNGAATNIIFGLALGYKSVIIPVFCLAATIYVGYSLAGMYGVACGAIGILSTLPIGLTIDGYGPICDNAGGIAEMAQMPEQVREHTDALDAAGNTTAAIGKGFAIGSAALVSLALFGAFVTIVGLDEGGVNLLQPFVYAGLLVGAMLPYWFTAMTMKSVGEAAMKMVDEVRRQIKEKPGMLSQPPTELPDYDRCIRICTDASLNEMIPPGLLVMLTPIIVGFLFGVEALAGVLAGSLVSGVQIAISASNTGGAWDNAKKYIEGGKLGPDHKKHTPTHAAAVIGDTVGDPLKDTSGPSLNILIKLMAIISVVVGPAFPKLADGGYLIQLFK